jgi:superfamily II DNA or RNA helicase
MKRFLLHDVENEKKDKNDPLHDLLMESMGYPTNNQWTISSLRLRPIQILHSKSVLGAVYWIQSNIHDVENNVWFKNLTCQPHKNSLAPGQPKKFSVSYINANKSDWIGLPRFYGLSLFGSPEKDIRSFGLTANILENKKRALRDYQQRAKESAIKYLLEWGGATIIADCGAGKTAMALSIAAHFNRKTLVLCNRTFLMQQWKHDINGKSWTWSDDNTDIGTIPETSVRNKCDICKKKILVDSIFLISEFCLCGSKYIHEWTKTIEPREGWLNTSVGWLQGSNGIDTVNKDIVVASIESISQCSYSKDLLSEFGLIIIDEMHHLAALTLSQVLPKLPARYILGISATPDRNDGLEHLLYWLAGPTCFVYKRLPSITGKYNTVTVKQILYEKGLRKEILYNNGKIGFSAMITCLSTDEERNKFLLTLIQDAIDRDRKKILIVTSIVNHAKFLSESLRCIAIFGGCSQILLAQAKSVSTKLVVATYQFLEEGYDDPNIDTLVMSLPRSKVQQVVGRCERTHIGKLVPEVIDIVDTFSVFEAMSWKRHKFYKSRGFSILRK